MGITDDIKDDIFTKGMRADAEALGDSPRPRAVGTSLIEMLCFYKKSSL